MHNDFDRDICKRCEKDFGYWHYDARGIEIGKMCDDCFEKIKEQYRPEIFQDPNYECDEAVEEA